MKLTNVTPNSGNVLVNKTYHFPLNFKNEFKNQFYLLFRTSLPTKKTPHNFHFINWNRMIQIILYGYGSILSRKKLNFHKVKFLVAHFDIEINKYFTSFGIFIKRT